MSNCCGGDGPYDIAVIGAGSAGFSAAITAAEAGAKVALIGYGTIGGTCVNVGCVPSKALIRAVEPLHVAKAASRFSGLKISGRIQDWKSLVTQKQDLVEELRQAKYTDLLPTYENVSYIEGRASFSQEGKLLVDNEIFEADKIIIATGSRPLIPEIPGIENITYLDSTSALELEELPRSMLIMGGGYIGAEIGQIFARAGVNVTIVCRSRLLPEMEPEISEALTGYLSEEGITIHDGVSYKSIEDQTGGVQLTFDRENKPQTLTAEKLVLTTGRVANIDMLNLSKAGIELTRNGGVQVDQYMQTSRENIYAAGDVTGRDQFVYMAAYGAKLAARNAVNGNTHAYDNKAMPSVVFTDPQVACVGLTESEAHKQGYEVKTSILSLDNVPRALAARDTRGIIKLVADSKTSKLLGAHILAPEGADSIQTAALAIKADMTYMELADMIFPYLTTVEGLKLAAQTFDMDVKKLSCCAG